MGALSFMPKTNPDQKWGCCLIIVDTATGYMLMGKRCKATDKPLWSFPGGTVEEGETTEQAAIRETMEEVGLKVWGTVFIGSFEMNGVVDHVFITSVDCCQGFPTPNTKEFSELRWISFDEIDNKEFPLFPYSEKALELFLVDK